MSIGHKTDIFCNQKTSDFWIVPIQGAPEGVKKIELEQYLIQILKPLKNKQKFFYWWQAKSNYQALNEN